MQLGKENSRLPLDRFIPNSVRSCAFQLDQQTTELPCSSYQELLGRSILDEVNQQHNSKIMTFSQKQPLHNTQKPQSMSVKMGKNSEQKVRKVNRKPYKVLDAPNLQDDYYLNLLAWSDRNQIAVALDDSLYLWSGCHSSVTRLYTTSHPSDYICSVSFCQQASIALGNTQGQVKLFDMNKQKKTHCFQGHYGRVGSLDWCNGLLASGSRDGNISIWDPRVGQVGAYRAHSQEICGLKWSPDGSYIASGGNDNKLSVFASKMDSQVVRFHQHKAAVKAIGWCPSSPGTLASGGGTADRHLRFFSMNSLSQTHAIDTGSQVCNLVFSKISNQMVSTHGYSLNQINVWRSSTGQWQDKSVSKLATLTGHTYRVLYLAMSPSGESIITGAGDETLRFWNVFDTSNYRRHETVNTQMDLR